MIDFGALDGPRRPRNHSKRRGAKRPAGAPGAVQTPRIDHLWTARAVGTAVPRGPGILSGTQVLWRPIDGQPYRRANPAKPYEL